MKRLLIFIIFVSSYSFSNTETPEWFYMPKGKQLMLETGITLFETLSENKEQSFKATFTDYPIKLEYGIHDIFSVGISSAHRNLNGVEQMIDPSLVAKLHTHNFLAQIVYTSSEEYEDGTHNFGGDSVQILLGYVLDKNFSFRIVHTPEYSYGFKDDDVDYKNGESWTVYGTFQQMIDPSQIWFVELGHLINERNTEDGEFNSSHISRYFNVNLGYTYKYNSMIEFIPRLRYGYYLGDNPDLEDRFTYLSFKARILY